MPRYSHAAASATSAVISRKSQSGARKTASSTRGIRIAAVTMRFMSISADYLLACSGSKAGEKIYRIGDGLDRRAHVAIAPLALLEVRQRLQKMFAVKIRPQRRGHVNLRVGQLP